MSGSESTSRWKRLTDWFRGFLGATDAAQSPVSSAKASEEVGLSYMEVFVAGGFPSHTYNPRVALNLEASVAEAGKRLCKLVTVTGPTKSGKTVLVRRVFPRDECVWVDGGLIGEETDFWESVVDQLDLFSETTVETGTTMASSDTLSGGTGINVGLASAEANVSATTGETQTASRSQSRRLSPKIAAIDDLVRSGIPLVIDDFHYIPRDLQGTLVRALKQPVFDGLPVVIIAIPHRRYDAMKVEKEMTGRLRTVVIPPWGTEELAFIPEVGFGLLGSSVAPKLVGRLADESIGSPHLMQEFCRELCRRGGRLFPISGDSLALSDDAELDQVFSDVAESIGRPIFEKLARGPRQRSDRIQRELKTGAEVDIYGLVLHALASVRPALDTLEYEDLRDAIRSVSADRIPQLHEVTRVLKHMSDIAANDQSSTPVIDFEEDEQRLHITDPFFAFYLRWGRLEL